MRNWQSLSDHVSRGDETISWQKLGQTCVETWSGDPQYTTVLTTCFSLGKASVSPGNFRLDTKTREHDAWSTMYSMASSPRESYKGTQYADCRLHAYGHKRILHVTVCMKRNCCGGQGVCRVIGTLFQMLRGQTETCSS